MQDQSSFINPETDIKMFINEHKSENDLPVPGSLDMQVQAADYAKYKEMLAEITRRELKRMNDEEEEKRVAQESLNPPEYVKKLVYKLVIENRALSLKEMDYVKLHIEKPTIRSNFGDFLMAFTSPRNIRDEKCLEMLGDIIKIVIDSIIEEKDNSNMKDLISIIHSS